jgi:non-lysosomal glucosylceramidase
MCTWPHGGRPAVPTRYCDEVWTGSEYQVAAHLLYEGLVDEGMAVLQGMWDRYDGTRRNPFNPIECGDHYIRDAAGWSVLEALAGFSYNALTNTLTFAPLEVAGHLDVHAIHLDGSALALDTQVVVPGKPVAIPTP